ncbi:MAG: ABC transporter ATP-binding protein [Butyrivibrio sp.]
MARNTYDVDESLETPFNIKHLKRAGKYVAKYKGKLITALLLSGIASGAELFTPILTEKALDVYIPDKNISGLLFMVAGVILCYAVSIMFATIRSRIITDMGQSIIYDIRKDLFAHLQKLPFSYYDDRPQGKILIRVVNYVNSVSNMLSNGLLNVILEVINMVFILFFMFSMNVKLSFVILAGLPVFALVMIIIKKYQRKAWQDVSNKSSNLNAYLQENLTGVKVTKIFAREKENAEIFDRLSDKHRKSWMKAVGISNVVWPAVDNIAVWVRGAIYLVGLLVLGPMAVPVGVILSMSTYAFRFWMPIMNLSNLYNDFINNIAYLERIFETMDEPVDVDDAPDAGIMPEIKGDVTFNNVTFSYEPGKPVLKNVSFEVKAGESVALVGQTGAGKSTIVNLLSRFYNLDSGEILIDGVDISKVTLNSLRSQMGIMLQDSFLFTGSIGDNIRYGRLDATDAEVKKAASAVCADRFINNMDEGYDTPVNERGSTLSQGQRQLISFARTLISSPKILVLDEATSSIDVQTERDLQKGLNELLKGRTSFIIAHRLSTIRNCDKIMVIGDGRITESGTHEQLMALKGEYYNLYTSQMQS